MLGAQVLARIYADGITCSFSKVLSVKRYIVKLYKSLCMFPQPSKSSGNNAFRSSHSTRDARVISKNLPSLQGNGLPLPFRKLE